MCVYNVRDQTTAIFFFFRIFWRAKRVVFVATTHIFNDLSTLSNTHMLADMAHHSTNLAASISVWGESLRSTAKRSFQFNWNWKEISLFLQRLTNTSVVSAVVFLYLISEQADWFPILKIMILLHFVMSWINNQINWYNNDVGGSPSHTYDTHTHAHAQHQQKHISFPHRRHKLTWSQWLWQHQTNWSRDRIQWRYNNLGQYEVNDKFLSIWLFDIVPSLIYERVSSIMNERITALRSFINLLHCN